MKVCLATGIGRLHFIEAVNSMATCGVDTRIIMGLSPVRGLGPLLDSLSWVPPLRRFNSSVQRRRVHHNVDIVSLALVEILAVCLRKLALSTPVSHPLAMSWAWRMFSQHASRHLDDIDLFHFRAGCGDICLKLSERLDFSSLCDHSIAHPSFLASTLGPLDKKFGNHSAPWVGKFWDMVSADLERSDHVVVNSEFAKNTLISQGISPDKVDVVRWSIPDAFKGVKRDWVIQSSVPKILFTGGFGVRKGAHDILQAVRKLNASGTKCQLIVAGNADEAKRLFPDLIDGNVALLGFIPRESLVDLMPVSDIYLFPSYAEGCAQSCQEAMASGLPVITTQASGQVGAPGETYLEVQAGDVDGIVRQVRSLLGDPALRERVGRAGSRACQDLSWEKYAQDLLNVYTRLLAAH